MTRTMIMRYIVRHDDRQWTAPAAAATLAP